MFPDLLIKILKKYNLLNESKKRIFGDNLKVYFEDNLIDLDEQPY